MHAHASRARIRALLFSFALGCSLLAACGGGDPAAAAHLMPISTEARTSVAAAQRPALRYATPERVAIEELVAAPYTLVIDADDTAAVDSGLQLADMVHTYSGGKTQIAVFARSRQPALAERLAERLIVEQGWHHVFVVR